MQDTNESTETIPISNKRWKKMKPEETPVEIQTEPLPPPNDRSSKKWNKNQGKPQKQADFRQSSNKPVNFDYSQANYQRFQGGSGGSSGNNNKQNNNGFKQKFKGGNNQNTAKLDKMFSFSNFRLNKKK